MHASVSASPIYTRCGDPYVQLLANGEKVPVIMAFRPEAQWSRLIRNSLKIDSSDCNQRECAFLFILVFCLIFIFFMGLVPLDSAYPTTAESPFDAAAADSLDPDHPFSSRQSLGQHTRLHAACGIYSFSLWVSRVFVEGFWSGFRRQAIFHTSL